MFDLVRSSDNKDRTKTEIVGDSWLRELREVGESLT